MLGLGNILTRYSVPYGILPHVDIPDCKLAFYADKPSYYTLVPSDLQFWYDQANAFSDAIAASAALANNRPTVSNAGTTDAAVIFDGSDDRLDFVDVGGAVEVTLDTSTNGWTVIIIATSDDWDGGQQAYVGDKDSSNHFIRHNSGANQFTVKVAAEGNHIDLDSPASLTDGQYYCVQVDCTADGNTITLYIDGTAQADTESLGNNGKDLLIESIGHRSGADFVDGGIKSILAFDRILTSDERAKINTWAAPYIG